MGGEAEEKARHYPIAVLKRDRGELPGKGVDRKQQLVTEKSHSSQKSLELACARGGKGQREKQVNTAGKTRVRNTGNFKVTPKERCRSWEKERSTQGEKIDSIAGGTRDKKERKKDTPKRCLPRELETVSSA